MSFKQVLIALDQIVNTLIWSKAEGFGAADETLSARAWRLGGDHPHTWGFFQWLVDQVFFWQNGQHCLDAYLAEWRRKQYPRHYRSMAIVSQQ